jgi:hypothetical protein
LKLKEERIGLLSDLQRRYDDARRRLDATKTSAANRASTAEQEFRKAWEELKLHYERVARGPAD